MRRDVSEILAELRDGRSDAVRDLLPVVYDELHVMAHRRLKTGRDAVLDTSALVHEAYLKLFGHSRPHWQDRKHFFSVAAIAMRQILVDQARRRGAARRGGGAKHVEVDSSTFAIAERAEEIVAINDALSRLSRLDEPLARLVELHYFGGLSAKEVAEVMDMSERTVRREWRKARALLYRIMVGDQDS